MIRRDRVPDRRSVPLDSVPLVFVKLIVKYKRRPKVQRGSLCNREIHEKKSGKIQEIE